MITHKNTILIIDDEPFYINLLAESLSPDNNIMIALNAQDALLRLEVKIPDLILLDILMPGMSGYELCKLIKENKKFKQIPIIFISTKEEMADELKGLELGAIDFLSKPFLLPLVKLRVTNILKFQQQTKLLEQLAHKDALTGIANRRSFDEHLQREWLISCRHQTKLSLLMIDVDYFKAYNDFYGHDEGDQCLQKIALALTEILRASDEVCRYGGEEFVLVLPDTPSEIAQKIAEKLCIGIAGLEIAHARSSISDHVTISIGVATLIADDRSATTLVKLADVNLYKAKHAGRNQVCVLC